MRISVWQQFSSNHSGYFTIVGTFENEDAAYRAAKELKEIMRTIDEWYERNPEADRELWRQIDPPPCPREVEIGKKYGIDWQAASDYWRTYNIKVLSRIVLFDAYETQSDNRPIIQIMQKLGGQVVHQYGLDTDGLFASFSVKLTCTAVNEEMARSIYEAVKSYLSSPKNTAPPWSTQKPDYFDVPDEGVVELKGRELEFKIRFEMLEQNLLAMIAYLQSKGCENIQYTFVQDKDTI